jgi:spore germination protein
MEIYVVQPNDTIYSIADKFQVPANRLIRDNELEFPDNLVIGQTIVIVYPIKTYITKNGDTLESIAQENGISQMQLLRNNPFLFNSTIIPGEELYISFSTTGKLRTGGYIYPYINEKVLKKTLPYLTYITIYNYRTTGEGDVISYYDDTRVVQISKEYGTIPLLMATTLSAQGEPDIEAVYSLLLNQNYQNAFVQNTINIIKERGYLGLNIVFNYMNPNSLDLYLAVILNLKNSLDKENLLLFVTINPNTRYVNNELSFDIIDYSSISENVRGVTFLQFIWGINYSPPLPVNSIAKIRTFIEYAITNIPPNMISVGISLISYDWTLPYIPGSSYANALSINSSIQLAQEEGTVIQFDEVSQSPFYTYIDGVSTEHIVWSVDARSIAALAQLISRYRLNGAGFWNLMIYNAQLWLVINPQFEIEKLISSMFD